MMAKPNIICIFTPFLRKYYLNTLKSASSGNIPQASKNLRLLDQKLSEED